MLHERWVDIERRLRRHRPGGADAEDARTIARTPGPQFRASRRAPPGGKRRRASRPTDPAAPARPPRRGRRPRILGHTQGPRPCVFATGWNPHACRGQELATGAAHGWLDVAPRSPPRRFADAGARSCARFTSSVCGTPAAPALRCRRHPPPLSALSRRGSRLPQVVAPRARGVAASASVLAADPVGRTSRRARPRCHGSALGFP
jgi:hypothetical protein